MNISGMQSMCALAVTGIAEPVCAAEQILEGDVRNVREIASNPGTSPFILETLARTANTAVLELVASNPSTPVRTLVQLACHISPQVRVAVSEHKGTPKEVIWKLSKDEDADVRYELAENHLLPEDVLKKLAEDENPYVASRAQRTLDRIRQERSRSLESATWKRFRKGETKRRLIELCDEASSGPVTQVNRFFSNLYNYARAF